MGALHKSSSQTASQDVAQILPHLPRPRDAQLHDRGGTSQIFVASSSVVRAPLISVQACSVRDLAGVSGRSQGGAQDAGPSTGTVDETGIHLYQTVSHAFVLPFFGLFQLQLLSFLDTEGVESVFASM